MSKRDKRLNLNKLNPLNEQDENALTEAEKLKIKQEQEKVESAHEYALEKQKLKESIDGVFKAIPVCAETNIILDDVKRLESLEQLLIDRLVMNNLDVNFNNDSNKNDSLISAHLSSSQYGSYLSKAFKKNDNFQTNNINNNLSKDSLDEPEKYLYLNNLSLNNECLNAFSSDNLLKSKTINNQTDSSNEQQQNSLETYKNMDHFNLIQNSNKIHIINLSQNRLTKLPINLLNMFNHIELIDLSENYFESIHLVYLSRFNSLKEINLSSNMLKSFRPAETTNTPMFSSDEAHAEEVYHENLQKLSTTLFVTVERLNLANNQLKSSNCLIISQFRNLKYLNLSNNNFQINSNTPESLLPWQKSVNHLKNLVELNLSKNNKNTSSPFINTTINSQPTPASNSVLSYNKLRTESALSTASQTSNLQAHTYMQNNDGPRLSASQSKSFNCLINLRKLDLSENNLYNIPNDIKDLKNLEELVFDRNFLEFIPNELTELRMLKRLSLRDNRLSELSDNFCAYARFRDIITTLDLSKNQLTTESFTYKIALFESLKELNLSENRFEQIPNTLPKNLEELNMNKNRIKTLMIRPLSQSARNDTEILKALKLNEITAKKHADPGMEFLFHRNSVKKEFNESIYDQPDIDQMEEMALPHVFYLRNLKRIHLADNHIQEIPADFGILNSNLEHIDLSTNMLFQLSVSLCRGLGFLKYLNLTSNRIRELTDKIRELSELEYLNLSYNRLTNINFELCNDLRNLKELYLNNNNLDTLPAFGLNKKNTDSSNSNKLQRPPTRASSHKDGDSRITPSSRISTFGKRKNYFTFSLPSLTKIDLSFNKFKGSFSVYSAFSLSPKLVEINLNSNKISYIDIDFNTSSESISRDPTQVAIELAQEQKKQMIDDEKIKKLSTPKYKLNELQIFNLSNNDMSFSKGGFVKLLCNLYKLAPNLKAFIYNQENGSKLGPALQNENEQAKQTSAKAVMSNKNAKPSKDINLANANAGNLLSLVDEEYYFDYDGYDNENESQFGYDANTSLNSSGFGNMLPHGVKKRSEFFTKLLDSLEIIDLSYNNLKKVPGLIYRLKSLKELYFNGNLLKKIPNEMYTFPPSPEEIANFERLKREQILRIEEENAKLREEDDEDMDDYEEELEKKKKKKKKNKDDEMPKIDALHEARDEPKEPIKLLADSIEVMHLNDNRIEHVPENLFNNFKSLKEIKLLNNPLKEPPQESVCISAMFKRNNLGSGRNFNKIKPDPSNPNDTTTTITLIENSTNITNKPNQVYTMSIATNDPFEVENKNYEKKGLNLPNLFFETNENLKPLQSYMVKYKKREGMLPLF